jgi:hypothetical protein
LLLEFSPTTSRISWGILTLASSSCWRELQ